MQRIFVASDLHKELVEADLPLPEPGSYDVVVLSGDISSCPVESIDWAERTFSCDVVMVAGTREHYGRRRRRTIEMARGRSKCSPNVRFLEDESVEVAGIRFVGATLWSDFRLLGSELESFARDVCEMSLLDYQYIWGDRTGTAPFTTGHAQAAHFESIAYIRSMLRRPFEGPTVVVTHHAPHPRSLGAIAKGDFSVVAQASDLEKDILDLAPDAWIHGCVHGSLDYGIGRTRIACNALGHLDLRRPGERENPGFDASRIMVF